MPTTQYPLQVGATILRNAPQPVAGEYVVLEGESYYKIANYDDMPPFFMTIVSDADHWLFISSTGGLSAGRQNANSALFPYYTEDQIAEHADNTGHKTILLITRDGKLLRWEPFSERDAGAYQLQRNLYKNVPGNALIFEENNRDLQLTFRVSWRASSRYGFVVTADVRNESSESCQVRVLSGLQNLLPYGVTAQTQRAFSVLLDGYKRNELDPATGIGMFSLSSTLTDLAEPSESLQATTVWQTGLDGAQYLLSPAQVAAFRQGAGIQPETDVRGRRAAYFVSAAMTLPPAAKQRWYLVAEVNQDHAQLAALRKELRTSSPAELAARLETDIAAGTANLRTLIANADGLQVSADQMCTAHHLSNVLFNIMRGGVFADGYRVAKADFSNFLSTRNRLVFEANQAFLQALPEQLTITELRQRAIQSGSTDLERLCYEYLPLTFSRRHGDPSRPWNTFSINLRQPDGSRKLDYQGNWRDIFQNWEPLAYSYPEFVENMISAFLNATTADGYNPYRVTRNGIEWEVPEPENPWANIGYWGDHQIIYLLKLLETAALLHPGRLPAMLNHRMFSHANVPYRIKPYQEILRDWYSTIDFDWTLEEAIEKRVADIGADGKLAADADGRVVHVTLTEKLLILLLAKFSNFVPEGGIWMNTQRPEWNDANNALVGKGLSVVTLCYLRRFIGFSLEMFEHAKDAQYEISAEVAQFMQAIRAGLEQFQPAMQSGFSAATRRAFMDVVGEAGSAYRQTYYQHGISGVAATLTKAEMIAFLELAQAYVEQSIRANRREDGLYHAYNTLRLADGEASIRNLSLMLEGQVAALSAGLLSGADALNLLRALRQSDLYRADQHTYILYPNRNLPGFLQKNTLSAEQVADSRLIAALAANQDATLMTRDVNGDYHFNGTFKNAKQVNAALAALEKQPQYAELVKQEAAQILDMFETHFDHQAFTGRSGTFFAYEGLGSIYWHMVSKLLLATQENFFNAVARAESAAIIADLAAAYYDIRKGLGFNKSPDVYGAFPTDPYSHTPAGRGAQQPGMTGQVKEEILTRFAELGVFIRDGALSFAPRLLRPQEFLTQPERFCYLDVAGQSQTIDLPTGSLAFTFCQTPIVYRAAETPQRIEVLLADNTQQTVIGNQLNAELSQHIFARDGSVRQLTVFTTAQYHSLATA